MRGRRALAEHQVKGRSEAHRTGHFGEPGRVEDAGGRRWKRVEGGGRRSKQVRAVRTTNAGCALFRRLSGCQAVTGGLGEQVASGAAGWETQVEISLREGAAG